MALVSVPARDLLLVPVIVVDDVLEVVTVDIVTLDVEATGACVVGDDTSKNVCFM